jgi:hypothetical protein
MRRTSRSACRHEVNVKCHRNSVCWLICWLLVAVNISSTRFRGGVRACTVSSVREVCSQLVALFVFREELMSTDRNSKVLVWSCHVGSTANLTLPQLGSAHPVYILPETSPDRSHTIFLQKPASPLELHSRHYLQPPCYLEAAQ